MPIIETNLLCKSFKRYEKQPGLKNSFRSLLRREYVEKHAVSGFSFHVEPGEFVGLIGQNGAGKTTLIKMLTGVIPPTSGSLSVLGFTPSRLEDSFKRRFAVVMGQKSQLFPELTASDTLLLFKEIYGIADAEYKRSVDYFVDLFGVSAQMNVQVRTLSLGERMKMELIVALLHNPSVLFLDEPTIGLDAVAQRQMRAFLQSVNRDRGTTILLTSHYMEDIKSLCPRCIVIGDGKKLYDGALDTLFARYQRKKRVSVSFASPHAPALPENAQVVAQDPYHLSLLIEREGVTRLLSALVAQGELTDISIEEEDIGVVVERIYAQSAEAAP